MNLLLAESNTLPFASWYSMRVERVSGSTLSMRVSADGPLPAAAAALPGGLPGGAFFVFLFRQFFRTIDPSLEEAARLDGATRWQIYRHIMLPLARPAVVTVAVLAFLGTWHSFLTPLIYLSALETFPISLGLRMYQASDGDRKSVV